MASYTFHTWHYYSRTGDTMTNDDPSGYDTIASTVDEVAPNIDNTLTPNENNLADDWSGGGATYYGTFDFGGHTFLVFQDVNFGYFLGTPEMNVPQNEFPVTWDFGDVVANSTLVCFAEGTLIATPTGAAAVETLRIGGSVLTAEGRAVPVMWIGHQTAYKFFAGARVQPVRIRAGALGDGLPHSDLTVTANHGMVIDGLVINASALVNGSTIDFVPLVKLPDHATYYHVETENHDVILANGAPAETFLDCPGRQAFDNYQEYLDLYGTERIIREMDRPRIASRRLLPDAIKARLGIKDDVFDFGDFRDQRLSA